MLFVATAEPKQVREVPNFVDSIVVTKAQRRLVAFRDGKALLSFTISLGGQPAGPKRCTGDEKTPEGRYTIDLKNPHSRYHKALRVSYPSTADRDSSRALACSPGGDVMIHGLRTGTGIFGKLHTLWDWTRGCIALDDPEIDQLYPLVKVGTPVVIKP